MKRAFIMFFAVAAMLSSSITMTGCQTTGTFNPDKVYKTSYCFGITASLILHMKKVPAETTDKIIEAVDHVSARVPATNSTFTVTWTPLVDEWVKAELEKKTIDAKQAELIKGGAALCTGILDYEMARHKKWKNNVEAARVVVDGFFTGLLKYVRPSNEEELGDDDVIEIPEQKACYQHFMNSDVVASL